MSSGKQTSFQYGEVSPLQHYKSNDAEYSNALHSLHNMYVRRTGGAGRIPGTKLLKAPASQENSPKGILNYQRYKILSYPYVEGENRGMFYMTLHITDAATNLVTIKVFRDLIDTPVFTSILYYSDTGNLSNVNATYSRGTLYIHGLSQERLFVKERVVVRVHNLATGNPWANILAAEPPAIYVAGPASRATKELSSSVVAYSAVRYLVTLGLSDGREIPFRMYGPESGYDSNGFYNIKPAGIVYPGDGLVTSIYDTVSLIGETVKKIKSMNVYRTTISGNARDASNYELVQKKYYDLSYLAHPIDPLVNHTIYINISDTGASVPSISPPLDLSIFTNWVTISPLLYTTCSAMYQERQIFGVFKGDSNSNNSDGDMIVSAIGSSEQIAAPIISANTKAFKMRIPVSDESPVRHLIATEKLAAFSDEGTYIMAGGSNGIITPAEINPIKISTEGASKIVSPVILRDNIVYLNATHTKLMMIVFGPEGQALSKEISKLSSHLFDGDDFIEMVRAPGPDDYGLLLKQSGELISFSVNEDGIAGFGTVDMSGGTVESIAQFGSSRERSLILSVIRNGIRFWETLGHHENEKGPNSLIASSFTNNTIGQGSKLLDLTEQGYPKIPYLVDNIINPESFITYEYINITTGTNYDAGETLTLISETEIGADFTAYDSIKFIYSDENGNDAFMYLTLLDSGTEAPPGTWTYTARADIDVPAYLQDVEGQLSLSSAEKLERNSRWLKAFTRIESITSPTFTYRFGIGSLYASLIEEAVIEVGSEIIPDGSVPVSILADNRVFSSPNNYQMATLEIIKDGGLPYLDLPEPVTFAQVGIPYESYMQTLAIEAGEGRTLTDDKKIVDKVGIALYNTIGGYVGVPGVSLEDMVNIKTRDDLDPSNPDKGLTGYIAPVIPSKWSIEGMIVIKQVDPTPMTVLSVYPKGLAGD